MIDLSPDCARCAGLCCVALPFDRSEMFSFDKAAGEVCRHLDKGCSCKIHNELAQKGFRGCVAFGCDGAGQRVIQEVFTGVSWQASPEHLKPMLEAFQNMRAVHAQLVLLEIAAKLGLSGEHAARMKFFADELQPKENWTVDSLSSFVRGPTLGEIKDFWRSLQDEVGRMDLARKSN